MVSPLNIVFKSILVAPKGVKTVEEDDGRECGPGLAPAADWAADLAETASREGVTLLKAAGPALLR